MADHFIWNGAVNQWHCHHVFLGAFHPFADRLRDFVRFAQSISDTALTIPDDNNGAEAESSAAFVNFCNPVNMYDFIDKIIVCFFPEQGNASLFTIKIKIYN
jgi:hypothetical protein